MREIKFRFFSKFEEKMYDDFYLESHMDLCFMNELIEDGKETYIFMQYTNLKDKKGNEIYEGDIVKTKDGIGIVEFVEFGWAIIFKDKMGQPLINYLSCNYYENNKDFDFIDDILLVIGNVYQNKKLLEG